MARRTRQQQAIYDQLARRHGRAVADKFFAAIADIKTNTELRRLISAIEAHRLEEALAALHLDDAVWDELAEAVRASYVSGGNAAVALMPARGADGLALVVRFAVGDPVAAEWLRQHSLRLVTRLSEETRQLAREHLSAGMRAGTNPRRVALDLVGRINRASGRREGGILGLSSLQASYVRRAADELASTDESLLRHYLTRERRNRRWDALVHRAIETGQPIPADKRQRMINDYEARLLQLRGETIARTEVMTALQQGRHEAYRQAIASGKVAAEAVTKTWRSARDTRVRFSHAKLDGQVRPFGEPFQSPTGAQMLYPMDTSLGAGGEEVINCRCIAEYNINFFAGLT